jgi:hypothetical protein
MTARCTIRRSVALLCLAAILLLAMAQLDHGLPVAVLAPFWIVVAVLVPLAIRREDMAEAVCAALCLAVLPSRAPPAR